MNELTILNDNTLTMSSREIAELTGKRHDNVMSDIKTMLDSLGAHAPSFLGTYKTSRGNIYELFNLPKRETLILVSGYNIELRAKIIDRWQELEDQQQPDISTDTGKLLMIQGLVEKQLALIAENEQQARELEHAKPAVKFLENFVEAKSTKGLREVAKVLGLKEREFVATLEAQKILFRQSGQLLPFAQFQHNGYFEVKTGEANGYAFHQTRFTPKGIAWITKRLGLA